MLTEQMADGADRISSGHRVLEDVALEGFLQSGPRGCEKHRTDLNNGTWSRGLYLAVDDFRLE